MIRNLSYFGVIATAAATLIGVTIAAADSDKCALLEGASVSLSDAIVSAKERYAGHAISAELEEEDGMYYYEIELISSDGHHRVYINPANGLIIGADSKVGSARGWREEWQEELTALEAAHIDIVEAIIQARALAPGHVSEADLNEDGEESTFEIKLLDGDEDTEIEFALKDGRIVDLDRNN